MSDLWARLTHASVVTDSLPDAYRAALILHDLGAFGRPPRSAVLRGSASQNYRARFGSRKS